MAIGASHYAKPVREAVCAICAVAMLALPVASWAETPPHPMTPENDRLFMQGLHASQQQQTAKSDRGLSVQSWRPDDWTTCTETRHGTKVARSVTYVGDSRSSYTSHPSPAYWKAMGCEVARARPNTPATMDSVMERFKESEADDQRREARAAAKGIKLCKTMEEVQADILDCMRRNKLADEP